MSESAPRTKAYTVKELADKWQCSQESIYALIRKHVAGKPGGLPAFSIGGKLWRIKPEIVEQWQDVGGNTRSENSDLERSSTAMSERMKPSSITAMQTDPSEEDLVSSAKRRAASRLTSSLLM